MLDRGKVGIKKATRRRPKPLSRRVLALSCAVDFLTSHHHLNSSFLCSIELFGVVWVAEDDNTKRKMRNTLRLLAVVKPGRYLEAGNPTGLTGLFTHPAPRSTLLYLYGATLDKLQAFPDHSVYRQSTEALTKHRMKIIESIKPEGYDEWAKKAAEKIEKYPEAFQPGGNYVLRSAGGHDLVMREDKEFEDEEWASLEGPRSSEEKAAQVALLRKGRRQDYSKIVKWESEPPLEASQYVRLLSSWI